jgi:hypothetical protein
VQIARTKLGALLDRIRSDRADEATMRAACHAFDSAMRQAGLTLGCSAPLRP